MLHSTTMFTPFQVSDAVGLLFNSLLQIPNGCQLYCPTLDAMYEPAVMLNRRGCRISAVASEGLADHWQRERNREWAVSGIDNLDSIALFKPNDYFHLALAMPPYSLNRDEHGAMTVAPVEMFDKLMMFECSRGKAGRKVGGQLLVLEALLNSVMVGGYFGAVMPEKWLGREMKFNRWWQEYAAPVARIRLPADAVKCKTITKVRKYSEPDDPLADPEFLGEVEQEILVNAPGRWCLFVWQRPAGTDFQAERSKPHFQKTEYAQFRYSNFIFTLESLEDQELDRCAARFRKNDWWLNNVRMWRKMLDSNSQHQWCGTYRIDAHKLGDPKEVWFFEPNDNNCPKVQVVDRIPRSNKNYQVVQVRPVPLSVIANSPEAQCILHDMAVESGLQYIDEKGYVFKLRDQLSREHYSSVGDQLIKRLCERGLKPYMTTADHKRMKKSERWLSIQLCPSERQIPIRGEEHRAMDSDDAAATTAEEEELLWEIANEDISLRATFPELVKMWEQRALKMRLNTVLFDFQFEDLVASAAAKSGLINGNVMGLGKTRCTLFEQLLLGVKRGLYIVPTKLIGVWQEEIENTIAPYIRRVRRNWRGDILHADYKIIEWGEQLLYKEQLATFNLITYDKLKSIPRDGKFFKCPVCEFITYSLTQKEAQECPRCNHGRVQKWKAACEAEYRSRPDGTLELVRAALRKHKVELSTGNKLPWKNPENKPCRVVDPRPPLPVPVMMHPQDNMYKKMTEQQVGYDRDPLTGIKTPKYSFKERDFHVKWTYARYLRWMFKYIAADEALYFANADAKRTQAVLYVNGYYRRPLTGTPVKGYPQKVLPIWNWCSKRAVWPNYRTYDSEGRARFMRKYKTEVKIIDESGASKWKQVPKINNPELFQADVAPLLMRHTRNEPQVVRDIPRKIVKFKRIPVEMDHEHRAYYQKWLDVFAEWWEMMKQEEEKKMAGKGSLLAKLGYLINASTIPHFMLANMASAKDAEFKTWAKMIGVYQLHKKPKTHHAKMLKAQELVKQALKAGDKVIVFSFRRANLQVGHAWCERMGIPSLIVDGTSSLKIKPGTNRSERHELVDKFRHYDTNVMWAGMQALAEGMNIPEANWGIFMDYDWEPSTWKQALGRMIRPQQMKPINAYFLTHKGTIDDYIAAWCFLKERAADEGVDYMEFDDFSVKLIPDIRQYADSIVDGTEETLKQNMWLAVEHIRRQAEQEGDEG